MYFFGDLEKCKNYDYEKFKAQAINADVTVYYSDLFYKIKKLGYEDGLMHSKAAGFFQDNFGVIWIANGNGFTRIYGDHFDHLKADRFVFQWGTIEGTKRVGNTFYWEGSYLKNNKIEWDINTNYQVQITQQYSGKTNKTIRTEFTDQYDYRWSFYYDSEKDSLSIFRHNDLDSLDVDSILLKKGIRIKKDHPIGRDDYWKRMPRIENFIEDNYNNIWINSEEGKLFKFDFNTREITEHVQIDNVAQILQGKDGSVWLSRYPTEEIPNPGISLMDNSQSVRNYPGKGPCSIYLNSQENLVFVDDNGVYEISNNSIDTLLIKENVFRLYINSKDVIYGTAYLNDTTEIFTINKGQTEEVLKIKERRFMLDVICFIDREDILWVSSSNGVYKCIPDGLSKLTVENPPKNLEWAPDFVSSSGDSFYMRTDGVYAERKGELMKILDKEPLHHCNLVEDEIGNVYLATGTMPPRNYFRLIFHDIYKISPDLKIDKITDGDLINPDNGIISNSKRASQFYTSKMAFHENKLMLFSQTGVYVKEGSEAFKFIPIDTSEYEYGLIEKSKNLDFQLYTFVDKEIRFNENEQPLSSNYLFDFHSLKFKRFDDIDDTLTVRTGQIWGIDDGWLLLSSYQGIVMKNDKGIVEQPYPVGASIYRPCSPSFWVDPLFYRNEWIYYPSTDNGILAYDMINNKFYQKNIRDGLLTANVGVLFFSPDSSKIYASSSFGIQEIDRASIGESKLKYRSWDNADGYTGGFKHEFQGDSVLIMSGLESVSYEIDLKGNYRPKVSPQIYYTDLRLGNDSVNWNEIECDLKFSLHGQIPHNLKLEPSQNHLTFFFQGVSHLEEKLWYEYKLIGLQKDWIKTENKSVSYPDLDPGDYEFQVKAVNEIGESEAISIKFHIDKPWYQTTLARITFALMILGGFFAFFRIRTAALRKRQAVLEKTVEERTEEVVKQKHEAEHQRDLVEEKNQEIMDSITYAKRLQTAILPPQKLVKEWLNDSFIFYKPKDIVAGDFYWMETTKRNGRSVVFYAAADCTGHGVPGAMVSVVCSNALKRAIKEFDISDPGQLLDKVAEIVQESFEQSEHEVKDGMDIAVCAIDLLDRKVWFSGAHNSLYRITSVDTKVPEGLKMMESGNRKLVEYSANKQPVGAFEHMEPFTTIEIDLEPGDCIYLFSDGFADQFGGEKGKKFKYKPFKQLLLDIEAKEMDSQKDILDTEFERWKGSLEQVDDVCIIGLRVNGHMRKLFSKRELEVIKKIKEGRQSKEIADDLNIAKSTVDTHRKRILAKTNLNNAAELIKFCDEHEVI